MFSHVGSYSVWNAHTIQSICIAMTIRTVFNSFAHFFVSVGNYYAEADDTLGRKLATPIFGTENRNRLSKHVL